MTRKRIGLAMSGGVDSSVCALLLASQGYEVHGFHMLLPLPGQKRQEKRVRSVANRLNIPLHCLDLSSPFTQRVIIPFLDRYRQGQTPNPCIICNQWIKFGVLAQAAFKAGMDCLATGHYAQIILSPSGRPHLCRGYDRSKDQSYFLCRVDPSLLTRILFPLGGLRKEEVRIHAAKHGLADLIEGESQDVCFLPHGLTAFLQDHGLPDRPGPICSLDSTELGQHNGISRFTIGQRRGLNLPDATPWYVVRIEAETNTIVVGKHCDLMHRRFQVRKLRWMRHAPALPWRTTVQIRSRHIPVGATLQQDARGRLTVVCDEPQRAITPGQYAVFYSHDRIEGSAIIAGHD